MAEVFSELFCYLPIAITLNSKVFVVSDKLPTRMVPVPIGFYAPTVRTVPVQTQFLTGRP